MGLVGVIMTFHSAAECLSSDVTESYAAYYLGTRDTRRHAPIHLASFIAPACYRNEYQSGYNSGYNSASSSHVRRAWASGPSYSMRQSNYPSSDYQYHRHNYDNRQQSSRNNYQNTQHQNAQHGYHSQRGVWGFAEEPLREFNKQALLENRL
ncbi:hypothetical protein ALC53_03885 [Atta colombica]|uniref:Uncharacterized protein n=1 Tax=Atta colombica TaxID=520822 RepID=A0A195BN33_9HYME|nr:hypothetical protein ALC53_03885 [Atta colombica]